MKILSELESALTLLTTTAYLHGILYISVQSMIQSHHLQRKQV
jgi:hypothetical protein